MSSGHRFSRTTPIMERGESGKRFGDDIDDRVLWIVFSLVFRLFHWMTIQPWVTEIFR